MSDTQRNPYPGLRPFQSDEDYLFFGREEQTAELLQRLGKNRFVAVVGASGSGKSSLVRCGLLSELHGGGLVEAGSHWEVAVMRPGGDPIRHLAEALIEADLYDPEDTEGVDRVMATLKRSESGLVQAARQSELEERTNLLVVVDQFEELFRFHEAGSMGAEEAPDFVQLLLEAANSERFPIYVVLTMRSDFLGDCSRFAGLAQAVNNGEYLIPRLNRDQMRTAIEGPAKVAGGALSWRLLVRLLNDVETQDDRLPVLQHGLMRLWDAWEEDHEEEEAIDLRHYEEIGGLGKALSVHADEIHERLPDDRSREIAEKVFQALTERGADNRGIRRPVPLRRLEAIVGEAAEAILPVLEAYRQPGVTFLMPGVDTPLEAETVIDISHESLMRVWRRLQAWVEDESQSARIYRRLHETAELHAERRAGLYRDPDLQIARSWRDEHSPNEAWAEQYGGAFERTLGFLNESEEAALSAEREAEAARQHQLEQAEALAESRKRSATLFKRFSAAVGALCVVSMGLAFWAWNESVRARDAEDDAKESEGIAIEASKQAKHLNGRNWLANARHLWVEKDYFGARIKVEKALGFQGVERGTLPDEYEALLDPDKIEWAVASSLSSMANYTSLLWQSGLLPQHQHGAENTEFEVSKDGRFLVTVWDGDTDGLLVWDLETAAFVEFIKSAVGDITAISFSSDGRYLACSGSDSLTFLRYEGGQFEPLEKTFTNERGGIVELAFSPDNSMLALGSRDQSIYLWKDWSRFDAESYPQVPSIKELHHRSINDIAFDPSGSGLLATVGHVDHRIQLVDTNTMKIRATLECRETMNEDEVSLYGIAFSPDGRRLVVCGHNVPVEIWDVASVQRETILLRDEWERISDCPTDGGLRPTFVGEYPSFSADGSKLAVAWYKSPIDPSRDGLNLFPTVSVFQLGQGGQGDFEKVHEFVPEMGEIWFVAVTPDGERVAVFSKQGELQLWDTDADYPVGGDPVGHSVAIESLTFSGDGLRFASGDERGVICLWDARTGAQLHRLRSHEDQVSELRFSKDSGLLFSVGNRDQTFKAWDVETGEERFAASEPFNVRTLDVSPDGQWVIVGGTEGSCSVYDARDLRKLQTLTGKGEPGRLRFLGSEGVFGLGDEVSGDLSLVTLGDDLRWGEPALLRSQAMRVGDGVILSASPDGRWLATVAPGGKMMVWKQEAGNFRQEYGQWEIPIGEGTIDWLEFSGDGQWLATSGDDKVTLWDREGQVQSVLRHPSKVERLAVSPDGSLLVTGGRFGLLQVWQISVPPYVRHGHVVKDVGRPGETEEGGKARFAPLSRDQGVFFTVGTEERPYAVLGWKLWSDELTEAFALESEELQQRHGGLILSPDEGSLVAAPVQADGSLVLWDLESKTFRILVEKVGGEIRRMAFNADGTLLAYMLPSARRSDSRRGGDVHVVDLRTGRMMGGHAFLGQAREQYKGVTDLIFASEGEHLIVIGGATMELWRTDAGTGSISLLREIRGTTRGGTPSNFNRVNISPDGSTLVVSSAGGEVHLRDPKSLEPLGETLRDNRYGLELAFSPDGQLLATSQVGGQVVVRKGEAPWEFLASFELPDSVGNTGVGDLQFTEDNRFLVVGSNLYDVMVYSLPMSWASVGPLPASYLDVIDFKDAIDDLQWSILNDRLYPPSEARTLVPIEEVYLPFMNETGEKEGKAALFAYYLKRELYSAGRAVLLSMGEAAPEAWWQEWREAAGEATSK